MNPVLLLSIPPWVFAPFWFLIVVMVLELVLPRLWILIENCWWRLVLGRSAISKFLRTRAMKDFQLSIDQKVADEAIPKRLAVLLAVAMRPFELRRLTHDLRGLKKELMAETFESAIDQLNKLWREGTPPQILKGYITDIAESASDKIVDESARLRGRCAIAVVKYALGDIRGGYELGRANWAEANRLESDEESILKWLASYGYFYATLFMGSSKAAMILMAEQWSKYYAPLTDRQKANLRERLTGKLILNPILAIPRHIILAAALNETPIFLEKYWPSLEIYRNLNAKERQCKIRWVEAWYDEGKKICAIEQTSLDFTHAYTGFYLSLLLLEPGMPMAYLHERINEAFGKITTSASIVAQYCRYGFLGTYHLICGNNERALDYLSLAASFSAISGNRFADMIFMCAHAVAAARLTNPSLYLEPDINYYLHESEKLARTIDRDFYKRLWYGAYAAVCLQRGEKGKAQRYSEKSKHGLAGNRILRIFENDALVPRESTRRASARYLLDTGSGLRREDPA